VRNVEAYEATERERRLLRLLAKGDGEIAAVKATTSTTCSPAQTDY